MSPALRADQLLSKFGYCSRREAPAWLNAGRVTWAPPSPDADLSQNPPSGPVSPASSPAVSAPAPIRRPDQKISPDSILIDGQPVEFPHGLLIVLHKPTGYACSHDPAESPLLYDLLPPRWLRRNPAPISIGRLDRDTSGLILITDDGALAHRLTSPKHEVGKTYEVTIAENATFPENLADLFQSGTLLLRGEAKPCLPAQLEITGPRTARLRLMEGKYHQVRRMFASQGCPVEKLHRSAFGSLTLEDLPEGQWCPLPRDFPFQFPVTRPVPALPSFPAQLSSPAIQPSFPAQPSGPAQPS